VTADNQYSLLWTRKGSKAEKKKNKNWTDRQITLVHLLTHPASLTPSRLLEQNTEASTVDGAKGMKAQRQRKNESYRSGEQFDLSDIPVPIHTCTSRSKKKKNAITANAEFRQSLLHIIMISFNRETGESLAAAFASHAALMLLQALAIKLAPADM
jgi:hypothetical protein